MGLGSVGGVVVENGKVINSANFDLASVETEAIVENLDDKVKYEALVNRVLREMGAEEKEVHVSVSDKDFIFKSLEMPFMKGKKEVETALIPEIEKHLPAALGELRWDYEYTAFEREKKISLSFVGIKEENLKKDQEIISYLGFQPKTIEPSSISLARILKRSKEFGQLKNFALLDFTSCEAYLTFFSNNLPIFSRYLEVPQAEGAKLDKFIESLNLSFQDFQRTSKSYALEKVLVMGNFIEDSFITALSKSLQKEVEMVSLEPFAQNLPSFVENLKALGVTERETSSYKFKPVLLSSKEHASKEYAEEELVEAAPFNIRLLVSLTATGIIISILASMLTTGRYGALSSKLKKEEAQMAQVEEMIQKKSTALKALKEAVVVPRNVSLFLEQMGFMVPEGVWLDKLEVALQDVRYRSRLTGYSYLGDSDKERLSLDEFIANLRKDKAVGSLFSDVRLIAARRTRIKGFEVTAFTLELG